MRRLNPSVNAELERLALQCLAFSPADRPQSMQELVHRLRAQCRPLARVRRLGRSPAASGNGLLGKPPSRCGRGVTLCLLLRPPYHARQLAHGLTLQQDGEYDAAVDCFSRALESQSLRREALYERARGRICLRTIFRRQSRIFPAVHSSSAIRGPPPVQAIVSTFGVSTTPQSNGMNER